MTESLQTTNDTRALLLANREMLSLERATNYLVSRLRTRTPLGAVEFLDICQKLSREKFDGRCDLVVTKMMLYSELFPREYAASMSPPFSVQREHEFYRLIASRLFPLDCSMLDDQPRFFWPAIPIKGAQNHRWPDCCLFENCQTVFKIALVLLGERPGRWATLGLKQEPARHTSDLAWTLFVHFCMQGGPLLRFMPLAFQLVCYDTGNLWLDTQPDLPIAAKWSRENVAQLFLQRRQAEEINAGVIALNASLDEHPEMIEDIVGLWDEAAREAARLEAEHGQ